MRPYPEEDVFVTRAAVFPLLLAAATSTASLAACADARPEGPGAAAALAGGGVPALYRGPYQEEVRSLLDAAPGWRTPADLEGDPGRSPIPPTGLGCLHDTYQAAALQLAWAAESYYRLRHDAARSMATAMHAQLRHADTSCDPSPGSPVERIARSCSRTDPGDCNAGPPPAQHRASARRDAPSISNDGVP